MRALVTGANGFLGRHVVAALLARGHAVRALVRPSADLGPLGWPGEVETFRADLRASDRLEAAFEGVDVAIHLAAAVSGGEDAMFASTVAGTERLLAAMARSACRRLVLASSFAVYDWSRIRGTLDEGSPLEEGADLYERDGYTVAKAWQERITRRAAAAHGWDLTVLRPGFIWGRDHAFFASLGQQVGRVWLVVGPTSFTPTTHVENCADLFAVAAAHPRARGETFNVVDGEGARIWSFLGDALRRSGERGLRIPVPYALAYGVVRLAYDHLFDRNPRLPHVLVPCRLEGRLKPLRFSTRKAREVLSWTPPLSYEECLARTHDPAPQPPVSGAGGSRSEDAAPARPATARG